MSSRTRGISRRVLSQVPVRWATFAVPATIAGILLAPLALPASAAAAGGPITLETGSQGVKWRSLASEGQTPEWGYKVVISQKPEGCVPEPGCRAVKSEFEIQRTAGPTQEYIVYGQNLGFTPEGGEVWVGVAPIYSRFETPKTAYSTELNVAVRGTKVAGQLEAPTQLWSEGNAVHWDVVGGAWGYKVVVSNAPRCTGGGCRESEEMEQPSSGAAVETLSPCLEDLKIKVSPENPIVYIGVGTMNSPGANPQSYTGSEVSLSVPRCSPPTVVTGAPSGVTQVYATLNGQVSANGSAVGECEFEYGTTTAYGGKVPCGAVPEANAGPVPVSALVLGLTAETTYHYRLVARNVAGVAYGADEQFATQSVPRPPPVNLVAPTITGVTLPGLVLKASRGVWANEPTSFTYQWQACNGFSCSAIPGVVGEAFPLTSAYVGDTIRVVVAAQNSGGGTTAASAFTGTVGSRVEASVEWGIEWFNAYTLIVSVEVVGVPHGATTEVTCHGKGCPFRSLRVTPGARQPKCRRHHHCRRHGAGLSVGARFAGHRLRPGTVVSVRVSKPGWEGRLFTMKVRSRHRPEYRKLCLAPGSSTTGTCI